MIEEGFFGQEINHTTYNLARMNLFLHNINCDKFHIALGNTLLDRHFGDEKPFDGMVSNSITEGLPREIELRQQQYEYYRNLLLSFPRCEIEDV